MKGREEMGVLKSNLPNEGRLRCSFTVGGFPSVALNNLAVLVLINTFSYSSFL